MKDNRDGTKRNLGYSTTDDDNLNMFEDYDREAELFVKRIKSEIQYTVFSSKKN